MQGEETSLGLLIYIQTAPVLANVDMGVLLAAMTKRRLYPRVWACTGGSECLCAGKCSFSPSTSCNSGSVRIFQQRAAEPRSCSPGECGSLRDLLAMLASAKHSCKPFAELAGMSGLSRALVWANRKHMLSISKILGFPESQDVCGSQ